MIKWLLYLEFVSLMIELCEFDFEPFNTDKKVSSLEQFLLHMNEDDIFDSFPWYWKRNCIRCCLYCVCVTPTQRDIVHRDIKTTKVLVSNSHHKSYKQEELEMAFDKKTYCLQIR